MPFFLPSRTGSKQAHIVLKFYVWTKDHTFRISKEKKIEKIMLSRVLNPLPQNHILAQMVDFFIAGHICLLELVIAELQIFTHTDLGDGEGVS